MEQKVQFWLIFAVLVMKMKLLWKEKSRCVVCGMVASSELMVFFVALRLLERKEWF